MKELTTNEKYQKRIEQWCKLTGLKTTKVGANKVLPWFDPYSYPSEFDHPRIFYYSPEKLYVLVVEPYSTAAGSAAARAINMCKGQDFSMVECPLGQGLWFPGACELTIISKAGFNATLSSFIRHLPSEE